MPHSQNRRCVSCPDPADGVYKHKCAPPSVTLQFFSASRNAVLCGFNEFTGGGIGLSIPRRRYRVLTNSISGITVNCPNDGGRRTVIFANGVRTYTANSSVGCVAPANTTIRTYNRPCGASADTATDSPLQFWTSAPVLSNTRRSSTSPQIPADCCGDGGTQGGVTRTSELSQEDTDIDALARASTTFGSLNLSQYESRTDSYSCSHRLCAYTATAQDLVPGNQYEGCVRIERRESWSGTPPADADETWHEVEPDLITAFTAVSTAEVVADEVDLPNALGWEYRVIGASIWPVGSPCSCPGQ